MFDEYVRKQLRNGEEIIAIIRRSPLAHMSALSAGLFCSIASFFLLYPLFRLGTYGVVGFFLLLFLGIFLLARAFIIISMNVFVVTNQRVIDINQKKMFSREVSECGFENIQEMTFRISGIFGMLFHVGTLVLHTAGGRADLAATGIRHPQIVQELISSIQLRMKEKQDANMSAHELVRLLDVLRANPDIRSLLIQARSADAHNQKHK